MTGAKEILKETLKESKNELLLAKGDKIAFAALSGTSGVWGFTQNELAGYATIAIGVSIIAHKVVLILERVFYAWLEYKRFKRGG